MSYSSIVEMAASQSLRDRITAAAASLAIPSPDQWIYGVAWQIVASPGWADKWDTAKAVYDVNLNPDTGVRTDVISDDDILAAIHAWQAAQTPAA
jgi:hypothetical protein